MIKPQFITTNLKCIIDNTTFPLMQNSPDIIQTKQSVDTNIQKHKQKTLALTNNYKKKNRTH